MKSLIQDVDYPDMICIQEARLKALNENSRGKPKMTEYAEVKETVETIFEQYTPVWSLADSRYAGTVTVVHQRLAVDVDSQCAFSAEASVDLLLERYHLKRSQVEGLSVPPPSPAKKTAKQLSMTSFFAPKKVNGGARVATKGASSQASKKHHPEGRLQFFAFPDMDVLQTYVPNNGVKEESFTRRREWDESMLQFLKDRQKILKQAGVVDRPLLWCGDFNCARDHRDGTHWERQENGKIYEFWTDPVKCKVGASSNDDVAPDNQGIPSFTPAERDRFGQLMKEGNFVDIWRDMNPDGTKKNLSMKKWDRADYTWRGHLARNGSPYAAKFQGKGQRLDYFLLSPFNLKSRAAYCEILGYGEQREGHFCGSDHCASILRLQVDGS